MDSRHQNPSEHDSYAFQGDPSFNADTKGPFDDFFPHGSQNAFGVQWPSGNFTSAQDSINGYGPADQSWPENPTQNANSLSSSNFVRDPSQNFSRVPNAYEYSSLEARPATALSNPAFDPALGFGQGQSNIDPRLSFASPQPGFQPASNQNETVSPQALQNYPSAYDAVNAQANQKVSSFPLTKVL